MVSKVITHKANAYFEKAIWCYHLMLERQEVINSCFLHLVKCFRLFWFGPLLTYQQFVFHAEINHKERERINTGQLSTLKLFKHNFLKMLDKLKVVAPVTTCVLGVEQLHESFSVDFAYRLPFLHLLRTIAQSLLLYFLREGWLVVVYGFVHLALHFVEVANVRKCWTHARPALYLLGITAFDSLWVVEECLVNLAEVLANVTFHLQGLHVLRCLLNDSVA